MTSCSVKTYYQVIDVKSTNLQRERSNYVYNDGTCMIVYNFWSDGGIAGFTITNLSDEIIYVDLKNTFYIRNGISYVYYQARSFTSGETLLVTNGTSTSSTTTGVWNNWPKKGLNGAISSQTYSGTSVGLNSSVTTDEKSIVAIPPHASNSFSEYKIMNGVILNSNVHLMVKSNQPEGWFFKESESPITFKNYIAYKKGENGATKGITNDFYIGSYTNYRVKKKEPINNKYAPDRFYVIYDQSFSSADSKAPR